MVLRTKMLILAALVVLSAACKTENEKVEETLAAFAEAVVIHRAPFNAYVHLDPADKAHVTVEGYAAQFEEREERFPAGTRITVGDVTLKGDRGESTVKVAPPDSEPQLRRYVMRRDGTKWRIWLDLKTLDEMRQKLDEARRLSEDGATEEAKEKIEAVASTPFRASRPDVIEEEAAKLRNKLLERERSVALDAQLSRAMAATDVAVMRKEADELATKIDENDQAFYPRLVALQTSLAQREKQSAIAGFQLEEVRARSYRDAWGTFREARFKASNNTGRPIRSLKVKLELLNDEAQPPIGTMTWDVVEDGKIVEAGATLEVKREIEKAPKAWDSKNLTATVVDLEFADEAKNNDEG